MRGAEFSETFFRDTDASAFKNQYACRLPTNFQIQRQCVIDGSIRLDLSRTLMKAWLRGYAPVRFASFCFFAICGLLHSSKTKPQR